MASCLAAATWYLDLVKKTYVTLTQINFCLEKKASCDLCANAFLVEFPFYTERGIRKQPLSFSDKGEIDVILFKEL